MFKTNEIPTPPSRRRDAHKGTFGHAMIIAGSETMSGAAVLSGLGALHSGVGKLTLAVPKCVHAVVAGANPCWMTVPLPDAFDDEGFRGISGEAEEILTRRLVGIDAAAIGPGLGQLDDLKTSVTSFVAKLPCPLVIDADALNALGRWPLEIHFAGPRVLTPHLGEFARMTGLSVEQIRTNIESVAFDFANANQVTLVLKSAATVVTDGVKLYRNESGNVALATGGTGDVLTGLITGLLGQRMDCFDAAVLGVYLHGLAADKVVQHSPAPFVTAKMIAGGLSDAWKEFSSHQ